MAASPEFYKPAAFSPSPCAHHVLGAADYYGSSSSCRTPTGSRISEPTTCPPAPRKPPLCKKRLLFHHQQQQQGAVISLRLDELERIFRPHPHPPKTQEQRQGQADKRRRSARIHRHNNTSSSD